MALYGSARIIQNVIMTDDPRLSVRCPPLVKAAIENAAACLGLNVTSFVLMTLRKAATETLREHSKPVPFLDLPKPSEVAHAEIPSPLPSREDKPHSK